MTITDNLRTYLCAVASLFCLIIGITIGWAIWHPRPQITIEKPAPAKVLPSGHTAIQRAPEALPSVQAVADAFSLDHRAKVVRELHFDVAPISVPAAAPTVAHEGTQKQHPVSMSCQPVHVDLSLVKLPDGSERVVASAKGGDILNAIDMPVVSLTQSAQPKWAAGALYDVAHRRYGGFLDRDLGPFRVGVEVMESRNYPTDYGYTAAVKVGLRF